MHFIIPNLLKQIIKFTIVPKWDLIKCIRSQIHNFNYLCNNINAVDKIKNIIKLNIEFDNICDKLSIYGNIYIENSTINWSHIVLNKNMIKYIKKYKLFTRPGQIYNLYKNINASKILIKIYNNIPDTEKIQFIYDIANNKNMVKFIKNKIQEFNIINICKPLSSNKNSYKILKNITHNNINWEIASGNSGLIKLLRANIDKIDYNYIMKNENAIDIIKEYIKINKLSDFQKINLSNNKNPEVLGLLDDLEKTEWICKYGNKQQIISIKDKYVRLGMINNIIIHKNKHIFEIKKLLYKSCIEKLYNII